MNNFDESQARPFIKLLHGDEEANVCWQVFHDSQTSADTYNNPVTFHARLQDAIDFFKGVKPYNYGIYCTLNRTDGNGRALENIRGYSFVFADFDNTVIGDLPLEPHLITQRDATHSHCYWRVSGMVTDDIFKRCQKRAAVYLGTDRQVFDPSRVVRVAGSYNCKNHLNPMMYNIVKIEADKPAYTVDEFETGFKLSGEKLTDFDQWCETKSALMEGDEYNDLPIYRERFKTWLKFQADPAVKGNGRSYGVLRAAAMGKDLGIPLAEAQQMMWEHYNDRIQPPYSEQERISKLYKYTERGYRYGNNAVGCRTAAASFLRECGEVPEPTGGWEHNQSLKYKLANRVDTAVNISEGLLPFEGAYPTFDLALNALKESPDNDELYNLCIKFISTSSHLSVDKYRRSLSHLTGITLTEIKSHVRAFNKASKPKALTHGDMAKLYTHNAQEKNIIAEYGKLWLYSNEKGIFESKDLNKVSLDISNQFNDETRCSRVSDYKGITSICYDIIEQPSFFEKSTKGIVTSEGIYTVNNNKVELQKPSPENRMRFRLKVVPDFDSTPSLFLSMLKHTFGETYDDQIRQLQQFFGLAVFGLQYKEQKACFLKGVAGSGKSTVLKILEKIVPRQYISNISPLEFDEDYKKAELAGKLLNLVPEISKDKPIPSDHFKSIIAGDTINAREPYGKVFSFSPDSGNWFNGNFYMTTRDQTDGFYRRWAIIDFIHAKSQPERDPNLISKICDNELPAILGWLIDGVKDYLTNGLYLSDQHKVCLREWKKESNSVIGWLHDNDSILTIRTDVKDDPIRISASYEHYSTWCLKTKRKPYSKKVFKGFMAEQGHSSSMYNGYEVYKELTTREPIAIN
ncbi:DNA primase family protein [Thalassotalea agariperforans]